MSKDELKDVLKEREVSTKRKCENCKYLTCKFP